MQYRWDEPSQLFHKSGSTGGAFGNDVIRNTLILSSSSSVYCCCEQNIFGYFHKLIRQTLKFSIIFECMNLISSPEWYLIFVFLS